MMQEQTFPCLDPWSKMTAKIFYNRTWKACTNHWNIVTRVLWYFCVHCDWAGISFLLGKDSEVSLLDLSLWPGYFRSEYTMVGGGPIWIIESFRSSSLQMSSSGAHQGEERNQTQLGMFDNWNQPLLVWSCISPHRSVKMDCWEETWISDSLWSQKPVGGFL